MVRIRKFDYAPVGKCPACEKVVNHADMERLIIVGNAIAGPKYTGISYVCRHCKTVLGVSIDQRTQINGIVREVPTVIGMKPKTS